MPPATDLATDLADPDTAPEPRFVDDRLAHWASVTPDEPAVVYGARTFTWAQWHDRVRRAAGGLRALGVGRGDVVAFLDKNHPACVEITLGAGLLGAATAIVNWRSAPDEVEFAVGDCAAKVLVVGTELLPTVAAVRARLGAVERVLEVTPDGGDGANGPDEYEAWLAASEPADRDPATTPDDVAYVMYSSGTTGRPKGVMLSHANMVAHTLNSLDGLTLGATDRVMVAMPLFHVGGSSYVQVPLHLGLTSVMTRDPDGASLAGAILNGANQTFLVPAVLAQVLQTGPDAVKLFGALKTYSYGAAPMPLPLLRAAMDAWPDTDFVQVYGLTEVCGVATHLLAEEHRAAMAGEHPERLVSAGRAIPGMEIRIVDAGTDAEAVVGESGEIWLRSPQVFRGYLGRPEATREAVTDDGWFRTGDVGRLDDDGFLFVEDRLKDMIISGGENIYSPEVERVLAEHPAVLEVAVIGVPDDVWGESVKAVVALREGSTVVAVELIEHCRTHLARFKCPRTIDVVDALPRNPTGKILKKDLRKPYWEARERAV